jgi:hypothetical protein
MANWLITVVDITSGKPIPGAGGIPGNDGGSAGAFRVDTTPVPKNQLGMPTSNQTSGPGYPVIFQTDQNGKASATIVYTCPQEIHGTWMAPGYINQPWDVHSGPIGGDVYYTVEMTPTVTPGTSTPNTSKAVINTGVAVSDSTAHAASSLDSSSTMIQIAVVLIIVVVVVLLLVYVKRNA